MNTPCPWHARFFDDCTMCLRSSTRTVTREEYRANAGAILEEARKSGAVTVLDAKGEPRLTIAFPHDEDDEERRLLKAKVAALESKIAEVTAERDALRRHYDAAGPEHNLLALLDSYFDDREMMTEELRSDRSLLRTLARSLAQEDRSWCDHACARCVPGGPILIHGYECARHLAQRIVADADVERS